MWKEILTGSLSQSGRLYEGEEGMVGEEE